MTSANIIGSGPNGLSAAITLAQAGVQVTVFEARANIGGACASAELTLPGFQHDLGASAFPMGFASPFFRSLPLDLEWLHPELPAAHPLDHGRSAALTPSLEEMAGQLPPDDYRAWTRLFGSTVKHWQELIPAVLASVLHLPSHPFDLARFGAPALLPAATLARKVFRSEEARALFGGCAIHSVMPLTMALSASVGMVLGPAAHAGGWPVVKGGSQALTNALAAHLRGLGGTIVTSHPVEALSQLPPADATLFDTSTKALLSIAGDELTPAYRAALERFRPGPGVFKIDYALSEPIPWSAPDCRRAATLHVGGTLAEITAAEAAVFAGRHPDKPFVLLVQPSIIDPSRAPAGKHTAWAYCHVPNGSTLDRTAAIEGQIERFALGFGDTILARHTQTTAQLEAWNANLLGGDLGGGAMTARQLLLRPTLREYRTSNPALYLCSSSTPPGGGVHGMCGFHAAKAALASLHR